VEKNLNLQIDEIRLGPIALNPVGSGSAVPDGCRYRFTLSRTGDFSTEHPDLLSGRCWVTVRKKGPPSAVRLEGRVTLAGSERAGNYDSDIEAGERAKLGFGAEPKDLLFDVVFDTGDTNVMLGAGSPDPEIDVEVEASGPLELWMKPLFRFRAERVPALSEGKGVLASRGKATLAIKVTIDDETKEVRFALESLTVRLSIEEEAKP
jgi:hypothetical protein